MSLEPAISIIATLGGKANVSKALGVSYSQVTKWTWPKSRGGTGGLIPQRHHLPILDLARSLDRPLTASAFLPTRRPADEAVGACVAVSGRSEARA